MGHRILVELCSEHALSEQSSRRWFVANKRSILNAPGVVKIIVDETIVSKCLKVICAIRGEAT